MDMADGVSCVNTILYNIRNKPESDIIDEVKIALFPPKILQKQTNHVGMQILHMYEYL